MELNAQEAVLQQNYTVVLHKLTNTILLHSITEKELEYLNFKLNNLINKNRSYPPVNRLELICNFLKEKGKSSAIINKLYIAVCEDVELVKKNIIIQDIPESYW